MEYCSGDRRLRREQARMGKVGEEIRIRNKEKNRILGRERVREK